MGFSDVATSNKTSGFGAVSKGSTDPEQILTQAISQGYEPKEKVGMLTRVGNVLSAFEPGGELATYARSGDVGKATGQYVSEVGRGLGSALPFLDPLTKPRELASQREGYADFLEAVGVPEGEISVAGKRVGSLRGAAGLAGDIVLDPGNLLLAPLFKGIAKAGGKGVGLVAKGLQKTERGQDVLKAGSNLLDLLKTTFIPAYKVKKISPDLVDFTMKLKRSANVGDDEAVKMVKSLVDKYGLDVTKKLPYDIEAGLKTPATEEVTKLIEKQTAGELPLGIRTASRANYFPRKVIKEPMSTYSGNIPPLKPTIKGAEKARVFETLAEGEKAGYKYLEAPQSLTLRLANSQRAQKVKTAINQLIAGEVKDLAGNPIVHKLGEAGTEGMKEFALKELKGYVAHPDVVDYMEKAQKVFGNEEATKDILKMYDYVQNIWKGSVTSYFPAFHIRNAMSNIFNNWVGGVYNPKSYLDASVIQKGTGILPDSLKKIIPGAETFEDAQKILAELGVTREGQFAVESVGEIEKLLGKATGKSIAEAPRAVGNAIENNARIAHYIEKVRKGLPFDDAAKSVNKFLFDYSDLTPFERNVLKRIFPFYTWSRKNIPLQIEQVFKQPIKYKAVVDAVRSIQSGDLTPEEKKYMPDYLQEKFGINIGRSEKGYPQILSGFDLPMENLEKVGEPGQTMLDLLTPMIKTPVEAASGHSFFYGSPISDTNAYTKTTEAIGSMPFLRQFLNARPAKDSKGSTYYQVDPNKMYLLKALAGRFVGTAEKITDPRTDWIAKFVNSLTGGKVYVPDIEKEKERQIMRMLKELGVVKTFSKDYIPKKTGGFGK